MPIHNLDQPAEHKLALKNSGNGVWMEELYDSVSARVKSAVGRSTNFVSEHPGESLLVGGLVIAGAAAVMRGNFRAVSGELKGGELQGGERILTTAGADVKGSVAATGKGFEEPAVARKTVEGEVIPDVVRPAVEKGMSLTSPEALAATAEKYRNGLEQLFQLPRQAVAESGQTIDDVAAHLLKSRAGVTGERFTEAAVKAEAERLTALNPQISGVTDLGGVKLTVHDDAHLAKLAASDLQFKYTPQLGQFFKATGKVSEADIKEAMDAQKQGDSRQIGQILKGMGRLDESDIEASMADQGKVKAALKAAREEYLLARSH